MGAKGSRKNKKFWINFAMTLCRNTRSDYKEGLEVTCQQYCESLRQSHKRIKNTDIYTIDAPLPPFLNQLNRIFGVGRPSTSEGSLRSRGSISSGTSQSGKRQTELRTALAKLTHAKVFPLEEIERVEEFVSKSKTRLHAFLEGDKDYQGYTVEAFLQKDSQGTEIQPF